MTSHVPICRHGSVGRYCPHCDGWPGDTAAEKETPCPKRDDGQHCNCWYDGEACCACGDPADPEYMETTGKYVGEEGNEQPRTCNMRPEEP